MSSWCIRAWGDAARVVRYAVLRMKTEKAIASASACFGQLSDRDGHVRSHDNHLFPRPKSHFGHPGSTRFASWVFEGKELEPSIHIDIRSEYPAVTSECALFEFLFISNEGLLFDFID